MEFATGLVPRRGVRLWDRLHGRLFRFGQRATDTFCRLKLPLRRHPQTTQKHEHKNNRVELKSRILIAAMTAIRNRFRLYRREKTGRYYIHDDATGKQESLKTKDRATALRVFHSRNEAEQQPAVNLQIARACLAATDKEIGSRTWQYVIDENDRKSGSFMQLHPKSRRAPPEILIALSRFGVLRGQKFSAWVFGTKHKY